MRTRADLKGGESSRFFLHLNHSPILLYEEMPHISFYQYFEQLAVLSSYTDIDYLAVYHYCRSVMIPKPFVSGCDNLSMIFDKNIRTYASLRDDSPDTKVDRQEGSTVDLSKKQSLAVRAHSFFIRFIRLHGDLFKWTLATSRGITDLQKTLGSGTGNVTGSAAEQAQTYVAERFDVNKCMSLIHKVLSDFEFFMRYDESSVFSEMLLVKLLAIAIFSVHHTATIFGERAASDPLDNSITESLALYFLFNFISR